MRMILRNFKGGIHPADGKDLTAEKPISALAAPSRVVIPMLQHSGGASSVIVKAGQEVKVGQRIGEGRGFISASVHASVSGIVAEISDSVHLSGALVAAVIIDNNGKDEWGPLDSCPDFDKQQPEALISKIHEAGVVGMGGAGFPTHVKLSPPEGNSIHTVIINGIECEPYLNADHRLMLERPDDIISGIRILMHILGAERAVIGIERNKTNAIDVMRRACASTASVSVAALAVKYPQGCEKMLIKSILSKEVPFGCLPMNLGVTVHNIGTVIAVFEAVCQGKPLVQRVVTVSGPAVREPKNLLVKIGTPIAELIAACGGLTDDAAKIICGGPMMGFAVYSTDTPVTKGMSGIVVLRSKDAPDLDKYGACMKCGRCARACPMRLQPWLIALYAEKGLHEQAKEHFCTDCIECGCCSYVCPAKRPLTQFIKSAKSFKKK